MPLHAIAKPTLKIKILEDLNKATSIFLIRGAEANCGNSASTNNVWIFSSPWRIYGEKASHTPIRDEHASLMNEHSTMLRHFSQSIDTKRDLPAEETHNRGEMEGLSLVCGDKPFRFLPTQSCMSSKIHEGAIFVLASIRVQRYQELKICARTVLRLYE